MEKYLRQYAEPGTEAVTDIPIGEPWQQVVVIPVCNETSGILRPLPGHSGRTLMILVVNQTEAASPQVSRANQAFSAELKTRFTQVWRSGANSGLSLYQDPASQRDVLLVDRYNEGLRFPGDWGVGHARKAGADLASYLVHRQWVRSPWIHCTDADVSLPERYFSSSAGLSDLMTKETAALVYPFRHRIFPGGADNKTSGGVLQRTNEVTQLYEYSLRYYVAGLSFAGSPYAFHTIGSTMAVNANHYAKVRGFPRRQAGEDFYLLNKLAKVGAIRQLSAEVDCEAIDIAVRLSDRVPFGTGAAVTRMLQLESPERGFLLYHPAVFRLLRLWLVSLSAFWQSGSRDIEAVLSQAIASEPAVQPASQIRLELQVLTDGIEESGADKALQHAFRQSSDGGQFSRQMHTWFDAFRTLKLVHYLRDHYLPSIPFESLLLEPELDHLLRLEPALPRLHQELSKGRQPANIQSGENE